MHQNEQFLSLIQQRGANIFLTTIAYINEKVYMHVHVYKLRFMEKDSNKREKKNQRLFHGSI